MTHTAAVYTDLIDSKEAGCHLGEQVRVSFGEEAPDALIVFASSRFDHSALLTALSDSCHPKLMVGSSSAGEFTGQRRGEGTACALALRSEDIQASAGLGRGVSLDRTKAARDVISGFRGLGAREFPYHSALIMTDARGVEGKSAGYVNSKGRDTR